MSVGLCWMSADHGVQRAGVSECTVRVSRLLDSARVPHNVRSSVVDRRHQDKRRKAGQSAWTGHSWSSTGLGGLPANSSCIEQPPRRHQRDRLGDFFDFLTFHGLCCKTEGLGNVRYDQKKHYR